MTSHSRSANPVPAIVAACALALVLAACGSSRVVREGGASAPRVSAPKHGQAVTVQKGDNLYRLAVNNGISPLDLAMWNSVQPPYTIYPGQRLRLYPSGGSGGSGATRVATGRPATVARPPTSAGGRRVEPTQAPPQPTAPAPATSAFAWRWPADGNIVARYVAGDPTRQGIDLAGRAGQPVRAAGDGVVVYSGSGLVGYGELVIVKHDEQWLSAYGHNRRRMVAEGERVKAGQQIAEMGRTGADRDMLHFEIRYNGKPVDPLRYLPAR
ncbi:MULTISPECIES: peptidoglycan DD-metalloendopeptidase family protein [unclassified Luteimonas]|uniref:peptidoglycan DD-metalloendopeptidase family protein n=1 Tax=unclassified Luteimonas TaxID=2629088 RepID=UPI0016025A8C|nr:MULTISPECIES: peptidoglycan DD-metalloendopeptidase family protein [unclassified Luteimonas]MBB1472507.1 peptidoglycan DD-metalloendopeptidase family protein [Luteimonas sp. MC1782]MBB6598773.1 peptidoglycan DD-metalloendopeptidase family protein [Luteimonas sp. MC1825]QOC88933.1 peptidoglycan DD-metalloendopeptidase family protein [Luteimonas sp. MC1825]